MPENGATEVVKAEPVMSGAFSNGEKFEIVKQIMDGFFRKMLALILVCGGGSFMWKVAFLPEHKWTGEILGFIMGTALTTVIAFYFHTSQGSVDKSKQLNKVLDMAEEVEE